MHIVVNHIIFTTQHLTTSTDYVLCHVMSWLIKMRKYSVSCFCILYAFYSQDKVMCVCPLLSPTHEFTKTLDDYLLLLKSKVHGVRGVMWYKHDGILKYYMHLSSKYKYISVLIRKIRLSHHFIFPSAHSSNFLIWYFQVSFNFMIMRFSLARLVVIRYWV